MRGAFIRRPSILRPSPFKVALQQGQPRVDDADDPAGPLPSGESIARDLQRFLRQRGNDEPPHPSV